ncbi:hypothetical protein HN011_006598 [Eciton burchellii]|nr:hypothetical protein HN011_006598 [Eciton burchellii]
MISGTLTAVSDSPIVASKGRDLKGSPILNGNMLKGTGPKKSAGEMSLRRGPFTCVGDLTSRTGQTVGLCAFPKTVPSSQQVQQNTHVIKGRVRCSLM